MTKFLSAGLLWRLLSGLVREQLELLVGIVWVNLSEGNREVISRILGVEARPASGEQQLLKALRRPAQITREKLRRLFVARDGTVPDKVEVWRTLTGAEIKIYWPDGAVTVREILGQTAGDFRRGLKPLVAAEWSD